VLSGVSSQKLLDTYDAERRPIAWLRHNQIFARQDYAKWATDNGFLWADKGVIPPEWIKEMKQQQKD